MSCESDEEDKKPSALPIEKRDEIQSMKGKRRVYVQVKKRSQKKKYVYHERAWDKYCKSFRREIKINSKSK